ncbi:hypothetical protein C5O25_11325 [Paramuribaculum intestinale]|uniref:Zinc-ribbon domain-containing protein n=1 Tax=Paramuribaculum intestinale TaxID=2094151 RepID=A0A2V1IUX5_9BACT|nr:hypothetical protein C5O25_11325 [Paramuribaculum intestinale]ROS90815.1 hypothetical protein EEL36_11880 [Muribaculaceae bacterium Isolate-043 (Harlan)]
MICPNCKFTGNPSNAKFCGKCGSRLTSNTISEVVKSLADNSAKKTKGNNIGRNDMCPCGSGKKYRNCHGRALS